jgi:hypothetical protein
MRQENWGLFIGTLINKSLTIGVCNAIVRGRLAILSKEIFMTQQRSHSNSRETGWLLLILVLLVLATFAFACGTTIVMFFAA